MLEHIKDAQGKKYSLICFFYQISIKMWPYNFRMLSRSRIDKEMIVTKLLFSVCVLHCCMLTPLIVANIFKFDFGPETQAILYGIYLLHYMVNFFIYAIRYRPFRNAYSYFLSEVN